MKTKNLPVPIKWAMQINPIFGIDWKHIDDDGDDWIYRRTFANSFELLNYVRSRYGIKFARLIEGYESATHMIIKERQNKKMIQHHCNVAEGDLAQDNFTKGWIKACENCLKSQTGSEL